MSYFSKIIYTADGVNKTYSIPFSYLSTSFVEVFVDGVEKALNVDFTFLNSYTIELVECPVAGILVTIQRSTKKDGRLVQFQNASLLDEVAQNKSAEQGLNVLQETLDATETAMIEDVMGNLDAKDRKIVNLATPVEPEDAVTKAYADTPITNAQVYVDEEIIPILDAYIGEGNSILDATEAAALLAAGAEQHAAEAEASADAASASESGALASEQKAEKWADEAEDVEVETNKYSAKHWATKAGKALDGSCAVSGTDTYVGTLSPAITAYAERMKVLGVVANANTITAPTLNLNSVGAKKIFKEGGVALLAGDITAGHHALFIYDSTLDSNNGGWVLLNPVSASRNGAEVYALATGTDTYAATLSPPITAYATGFEVHIKIPNTNTATAPTLNLNSVGAKKIFKRVAEALLAGDLEANGQYTLIYDATLDSSNGGWVVKNPQKCVAVDSDKVDNYHAGHSSGQVPVSDGAVCSNLNADMLDGHHYSGTTIRCESSQTLWLSGWGSTGIPYINYNQYAN